MSFPLRIAALGLLLLTACAAPAALAQLGARPAAQTPGEPNPPTPQPANPPADWLGAYFTDPYAAGARAVEGGPDELLAAAIDQARSSVDMAIYDLNLWSVRDALLAAQRRGVVVRLVVEADNRGRREFDELAAALVDVIDSAEDTVYFLAFSITLDEIGDALVAAHQRGVEVYGVIDDAQVGNQGGEYEHLRRNGVAVYLDEAGVNLHDKVLIVDDAIVVMGSYNFSSNAERRNDENTLIIYSEALASQYREHFRQVWSLTER
jgi:phosphatidylserine/phosphatidylglycerophosphate/cardiolipin synthase-like enzyme